MKRLVICVNTFKYKCTNDRFRKFIRSFKSLVTTEPETKQKIKCKSFRKVTRVFHKQAPQRYLRRQRDSKGPNYCKSIIRDSQQTRIYKDLVEPVKGTIDKQDTTKRQRKKINLAVYSLNRLLLRAVLYLLLASNTIFRRQYQVLPKKISGHT